MAEVPTAHVEELPSPMATSLSDDPRNRHPRPLQCLARAHTKSRHAGHLS
jgi:hypothetical protein